jgi:solute carrier family 35 protein F1/2
MTALALGQVLSMLITGTGVFSQLLSTKYNVNVPTAQSTLNYLLLAIVYGILYFRKVSFWATVKSKWFIYFPLAFVDVEANYFVVKAYQFTSITSVMLLDCFTIPCVMAFTFFILKTRYNWRHLVGVLACLGGLGVLVYSDASSNKEKSESGPSPIFGDILCLVGAFLYAVSNTGQEITVKKWHQHEFLAMIGVFGAPISFLQLVILERHEVLGIGWNLPVVSLIIAFALVLFIMYSVTPYMMVLSGSTLFNLSLLTSDAYAILFGLFLFHSKLHWTYWIALAIIAGGLCLYNIRNEPATSAYDLPQSPDHPIPTESDNIFPASHRSDLDLPVVLDVDPEFSSSSASFDPKSV